jgi:hypothetical protein
MRNRGGRRLTVPQDNMSAPIERPGGRRAWIAVVAAIGVVVVLIGAAIERTQSTPAHSADSNPSKLPIHFELSVPLVRGLAF